MIMSEKLFKGIAAALKLDAEKWLGTLQNEAGEWLEEEEVAAKIAETISERVTAAASNSRKSGQAEINAQIRKFTKSQGFDNPDGVFGSDLLTAFLEWKEENSTPAATGEAPTDQMDKETLLKLPVVKELILHTKQEAGKMYEAQKKEFETYKAQVEADKAKTQEQYARDVAKRHTADALRKGNVILKVDGTQVSENERIDSVFDRMVLKYKFGLNAKGEPIVLGEDGTHLKDEFGNEVPFNQIAVAVATPMYGVSAQNPNHEGANPPGAGSAAGNGEYRPTMKFANQAEYDNYKMKEVDPAKRLEATKSWQYQQDRAAGN